MVIQVQYIKHGQIELFSGRLSFASLLERDEYIMRMAQECSYFVSFPQPNYSHKD